MAELPLPSIAEGRSSCLSPPPSRKWSAATAAFLGRAPSPFCRPGKRQWPHVTLLRAGGARPLLPPLAKLPLPSGSKGRQRLHVLLHRVWTLLPPSAELSRPNSLGQAPSPFRSRGKRSHLPLLGAGGARPPLPPSAELPQPSLAEGGGGGLLTPSAAHSHCRFPRRPGSLSLPTAASLRGRAPSPFPRRARRRPRVPIGRTPVARAPSGGGSASAAASLGGRAPSPFPLQGKRRRPHVPIGRAGERNAFSCPGYLARVESGRRCLPRRPGSLSLPLPREAAAASRTHLSSGQCVAAAASLGGRALSPIAEGGGSGIMSPSVARGRCRFPRQPSSLSCRRGKRQLPRVRFCQAWPPLLPSAAEIPLPSVASEATAASRPPLLRGRSAAAALRRPRSLPLPWPKEAAVASRPPPSRVAAAASLGSRSPSPVDKGGGGGLAYPPPTPRPAQQLL